MAWEFAVLNVAILHRKDKAVEAPARVKARARAGVKAKAEAPERVEVGSLRLLTNQPFN